MPKWIQVKEQMEQTDFREEIEKLFIDYTPEKGCVSLIPKLTGVDEKQEVETEYNLGWHITMLEGKLALISHNTTSFKIMLCGETGWNNSDKVLQNICRYCYSSTELEVEANCLTSKEFAQLGKYLQNTEESGYYLIGKGKSVYRLFVRCAFHARIENRTLCYHKDGNNVKITCSVRPKIVIPDNASILVGDEENDGSTPQRKIKIRFKEESKQERIDELKREIQKTEQHLRNLKNELNRLTNRK